MIGRVEGEQSEQPGPTPPTGQPGGYGRPGYPGAPGQSGYPGAPGQSGGYGAPAQPGGYGAPAQSGGYGAPGQSGGYGAPAQPGGYGQPGYPGAPAQPGGYRQAGGYPASGGQPSYSGGADRPAYQGGATPSAGWPTASHSAGRISSRDGGALVGVIALALGALLALSYAVWALTARRGVFADFSDGVSVTRDDAKSSDRIDTILLIVAGLFVVIGLAVWVMRMVNQRTKGRAFDLGGLLGAGLGLIVVLVGLFLDSGISDGTDRADQGDKGVTATMVTGAGFFLLAVCLLIGAFAVSGGRDARSSGYPQPGPNPYQNW